MKNFDSIALTPTSQFRSAIGQHQLSARFVQSHPRTIRSKALRYQSARNRLRRRSRGEAFGNLSCQPVFPASKYTGAVFTSARFGTPVSLGAWCKRIFRSDLERDVGAQDRLARVIMISAQTSVKFGRQRHGTKIFEEKKTMGNFTRRGFWGSLSGGSGNGVCRSDPA